MKKIILLTMLGLLPFFVFAKSDLSEVTGGQVPVPSVQLLESHSFGILSNVGDAFQNIL